MSTDIVFKDHFSGHAAQYASARPQYPRELFEFINAQCSQKTIAWDCAAGNGQAGIGLSPFFETVVATDGSINQLRECDKACNDQRSSDSEILRVAMLAEQVALQSCSVDLVVVAQALHWFDSKRFFAEVDRVLKPGGVIAVWCYGIQHIDADVDRVIAGFYDDILGAYWPEERRLVEAGYRHIEFPYKELSCPTFQMQKHWCLEELFAYFASWSAVQRYRRSVGEDPLELVKSELQEVWSGAKAMPADRALSIQKVISWPLSLRVAVKPV
jgi:ubiquinone/menaquinone biosynthesis C-methylase UbiE